MADSFMPHLDKPVQIPSTSHFARRGVYFLWFGDEVVYVGQAENMRRRIGEHMSAGVKNFDGVSCVPCATDKLQKLERHYIQVMTPRFNKCSIAQEARRLKAKGMDLSINSHTQAYISPTVAAGILGITTDELNAMGSRGPRSINKRTPRTNVRRKLYVTASVLEYASARTQ